MKFWLVDFRGCITAFNAAHVPAAFLNAEAICHGKALPDQAADGKLETG